jgi:hypothetical protein
VDEFATYKVDAELPGGDRFPMPWRVQRLYLR